MRTLLAMLLLALFTPPALAIEPPVTDRFGPGTQWYQPGVSRGKAKRVRIEQTHARVAKKARAVALKVVGMTTIRAKSGATAIVASSAAPKFQALVDRLEADGARIAFMGGLRKTRIAGTRIWSKHASGHAIDICQVARNVVRCRLPSNATQIAAALGLTHGAVWRRPDAGHFETAGGSSYSVVERDGRKLAVAWQ